MTPRAVLHVTSLLGGGVDRHVRDIARTAAGRHLVWYASEDADVVEVAGEGRFFPLDRAALERDPEALERWLRGQGVGIVHAHSASRAARRRVTWAANALATAVIVTLHDILFLRREGFEPGAPAGADPAWLAETAPFLRGAAAVLAPSEYLAQLARASIDNLQVTVVPNGSAPDRGAERTLSPRAEFAPRRPRHAIAVLGAIGPHKGAELLEELSRLLQRSGIAIVIVGYLDRQVLPGWRDENLFVHGAYDDDEVTALMRAYGAELALFPNRVPESFSYALSDAWRAGLPAVVPPVGALAERVSRHGGGWLLPEGFGAADVAALAKRLLSPAGSQELARVKSQLSLPDPQRVPPLDAMTRSLDALYERFGIDPQGAVDAHSQPVQDLIARNLDGALFRQELVRLADEFAQERAAAAQFAAEARQWIAKLEGDVAAVQAEIAREVEARRALGQEIVQLKIHKDAFDLLPEVIRKLLLKKILDARS